MRFLLDQNLPVRLCALLAAMGHEALHVEPLGLGDASDREIWAEARARNATVISKDSDFQAFAGSEGCFVRLRIGNRSNRDLFEIVERAWPVVVERIESGERVVEVRA